MSAGPLSYCALSPGQCMRLVQEAAALASRDGVVYQAGTGLGKVDPQEYSARESFLNLLPPLDWVAPVLESALIVAARRYGFRSLHLVEMPRLLTYAPGGHFAWHVDSPPHVRPLTPARKVTVSVQLTDAAAYEGGEFLIESPSQEVETVCRMQGNLVAFPAWLRHRVMPVTQGTRRALVAWGYEGPK
ncbi:MAG: 2OG-Fe(II) oxygenase [Aquabacterium commune]|uniref:2OG-Fe(II) oxygenase n=1 Tax=Aquabacterium commune TaxID=70586 RepID=UPI003BB1417B